MLNECDILVQQMNQWQIIAVLYRENSLEQCDILEQLFEFLIEPSEDQLDYVWED